LDAIDHLAGTPSDLPHWRPDMRDVLCLPLSHEMTDDHDRVAPAPFALANTPSAVYELVLVADLARTNGPLATIVDAPLAGDALAKIADVGSQHAIGRLVADLAELLAELADGEEQLEALDDVLAHR
jgi:hypothetical protein